MPRARRDPKDYDPEVDRFEEYLEITEDKSLIDVRTADELVEHLEDWFRHIEVPQVFWGALAKSMLAWMIEGKQFKKELLRPVRIVKMRRKVRLIRSREKWTKREIGLLRFRYGKPEEYSVKEIAENFGRSLRSIYNKANRLRFKRRD